MVNLYSWPEHPVAAMTAALLQAHVQTGEPIFLEPLLRMAAMRRAHLAAGDHDGPPGSAAWAAHRLPAIINDALAKLRQLTGDPRFDDLLRTDANGYVHYLLTGDDTQLARELGATASTLSLNWPMFTSEVRFTDRVLAFPRDWPRPAASGLGPIDPALLYSTITGDPGSVGNFPLNGARWHMAPKDFAVLVTENRRDRFAAELHQFGDYDRSFFVSLLTLDPGRYTWTLFAPENRVLNTGESTISAERRRLFFDVPAHLRLRLVLQRKE
ncbi:MAG: hypothetical protein EXS43_06205 [Opitutus sp.]|nr:hypothetical protein [Opitutus sp.]